MFFTASQVFFESLQECRDTRVLMVCRWPRLAAHNIPILCHGVSGNFLTLMIHIETVCELQVFSLKQDPLHCRGQCNRRAAPACCVAQWHKCFFVLSCESCIICRLSVPAGLNDSRVLEGLDPHGSVDPALNPSDFYLLAEAAISSIAAWHCSWFCRASRLESHLPVLGHSVPPFRFGPQRYWGCMAASVCFASVSPRRLSAWAQLFQPRLTPAN